MIVPTGPTARAAERNAAAAASALGCAPGLAVGWRSSPTKVVRPACAHPVIRPNPNNTVEIQRVFAIVVLQRRKLVTRGDAMTSDFGESRGDKSNEKPCKVVLKRVVGEQSVRTRSHLTILLTTTG